MAARTMKTTLLFQLAGCGEHEAEVVVTYYGTPGDAGDRDCPPSDPTVEIETVVIPDGKGKGGTFDISWLLDAGFYSEAEIADLCMQDWIDADECERDRAAEYRADQRRDDAMMERF